MAPFPVDTYGDLSITDLMNEDLWTLDDSQSFTALFNDTPEDEWSEDSDEDPSDTPVVCVDDETLEPSDCDEPFDWFNEFGKIYDV